MDAKLNEDAISCIKNDLHSYELLHDKSLSYIKRDPELKKLVHRYKTRFKDLEHLKNKIERKNAEDLLLPLDERKGPITCDNIKQRITDICGIRILHLYIGQFEEIHKALMKYVDSGELALYEAPKAYTWDPEYSKLFESLGVAPKLKDSFYTSVHYVFKPRADSDITCEVQVRTLFEEVWGEIDHSFNYPNKSESKVVQEQLKVLARVVGAGTRLSDSIYELNKLQK
ncbi:RelA/SpoT domain-containing protein [Enterobacter roggenkampii]|uniref:RelA/SpoT domain-containing protein n=1 Tax=Enterobacter roggenkampii TaxID=1812935 RepID=UPI00201949FF|nr:RelA/SpoT domain-containing protein [Enterobacter roggenkampii]UQQ49973.1 RelA/SpoT domain-containing protein [Enterobacter roggenkampii]